MYQREAPKHGMTPGQYQGSVWLGDAEQTGVRSTRSPWLDSFEARVVLTAKKLKITPAEALRRFIRGEVPLWSFGGAAGTTIARESDDETKE
jgi:hypothetical protein